MRVLYPKKKKEKKRYESKFIQIIIFSSILLNSNAKDTNYFIIFLQIVNVTNSY